MSRTAIKQLLTAHGIALANGSMKMGQVCALNLLNDRFQQQRFYARQRCRQAATSPPERGTPTQPGQAFTLQPQLSAAGLKLHS